MGAEQRGEAKGFRMRPRTGAQGLQNDTQDRCKPILTLIIIELIKNTPFMQIVIILTIAL